MPKMHVQAKLSFSTTNTATEQTNYTVEGSLSFRYVNVFTSLLTSVSKPGVGVSLVLTIFILADVLFVLHLLHVLCVEINTGIMIKTTIKSGKFKITCRNNAHTRRIIPASLIMRQNK